MILSQVNKLLVDTASSNYLVHQAYAGDVYDIDSRENRFGVFVATPMSATKGDNGTIVYNYTLYYIDRLTQDESNMDFVQSDAVSMLKNLIAFLEAEQYIGIVDDYEFTIFKHQFNDWCAGAYVGVEIVVPDTDCGEHDYFVNSHLAPLSITENGNYRPRGFDGFNEVFVNVPGGPLQTKNIQINKDGAYELNFQPLTVTKNGTYVPEGDVDAFDSVEVNIDSVSEDWVEDKIDEKLNIYDQGTMTDRLEYYVLKSELPNLTDYATKTWVNRQGFLTAHQSLAGYARTADIPSLTGYATKEWVINQDYVDGDALELYALKTEIPSLDNYATKTWVSGRNYSTKEWVINQCYLTEDILSDMGYATKEWVMNQCYLVEDDLEGYATKAWVENKCYLDEEKGDARYVRKSKLPEILEPYATIEYVDDRIVDTKQWVLDKDYATNTYVDNQIRETVEYVDEQIEETIEYVDNQIEETIEYVDEQIDQTRNFPLNLDLIKKICPYFYVVNYNRLDYDYAKKWFGDGGDSEIEEGLCTAYRKDNLVGRNYDWIYNHQASFLIRTPEAEGRHSVIGVGGSLRTLTGQFVDSREYSDLYKVLPFFLQDGVNDKGLFAEMNVVPSLHNNPTVPVVEKKESICVLMLVRYILDRFDSVDEAIAYINAYVEVFNHPGLEEMGYECHLLLADGNGTKVLEIVDDRISVIDTDKSTNFHLTGVEFNDDGTVFTPYDAIEGNLPTSQGIEEYGMGLERWNILVNSDDMDMRELMKELYYTKTYTNTTGIWFSELVGGDITVDTRADDIYFIDRLEQARCKYEQRSRDTGETWHTVHSCVYDLDKLTVNITIGEGEEEYSYELSTNWATVEYVDEQIENTVNYIDEQIENTVNYIDEQIDETRTWVENNYATETDLSGKIDRIEVWTGTESQWNALTPQQQASYLIALIKED